MEFLDRLEGSFVAGLLLLTPFVVTLVVLGFLMDWALLVIDPVAEELGMMQYTANDMLLAKTAAGISVVSFVMMLGYISNHIGISVKGRFGRLIGLIPLFGPIYLGVRQVASSIGDRESRFKKLVILEYPRENIYSVGLLTSKAPSQVQAVSDEDIYSVFVPNSPNPTGGRTVLLPESEFEELDMSVQKGLKLMLTTGMAFEDEL